uniref:Uncharacterized protein n=1 Tax=Oryza nivara TaxID=4536 RepID=A0A0E0GUD3_ORYNI
MTRSVHIICNAIHQWTSSYGVRRVRVRTKADDIHFICLKVTEISAVVVFVAGKAIVGNVTVAVVVFFFFFFTGLDVSLTASITIAHLIRRDAPFHFGLGGNIAPATDAPTNAITIRRVAGEDNEALPAQPAPRHLTVHGSAAALHGHCTSPVACELVHQPDTDGD